MNTPRTPRPVQPVARRSTSMPNTVVSFRQSVATSVARFLSTGEDVPVFDKMAFLQYVTRRWRKWLNLSEISAVIYLADRTICWGKDRFTASVENILKGTDEYAGLGISRATYFRMMDRFESLGIIRRKPQKHGRVTIIFNPQWNPEKTGIIPVPKRLKAKDGLNLRLDQTKNETLNTDSKNFDSSIGDAVADAPTPRLFVPGEKEKKTTAPENENQTEFLGAAKESGNCDQEEQPVAIRVRQRISRIQAESRAAVARKADDAQKRAAERKSGVLTATELERIWIRALMEAHPLRLHVAWSRKEQGMVKQAQRKWAEAKTGTFAEFLDFAARNWGAVVQRKLAWMTKPAAPTYPSLDFLIWRLRDFVEVWIDRKSHVFATDADNDRYARLIAAGMGHDEAVKEIAREQAALDMRREMERREANVAKQARRAKEREERAARLEGFTERAAQLPDGSQVKVTPGTQRRPGQVWGHQPIVKIEKPQPVAPETPRPEPPPLVDASNMLMITETWEEARARVMAEQAAKRNKEIAAAKARMEAQPKPVLNLMITETWEEARARRKANRLNLNGEDERRCPPKTVV
ncbi:hypothetical protein BDE18_0604 [Paracoccus pantotrophus]|uniref:Uncharacterized protein n=2 Tax=Paracoccus pantotrophus TaxID=82367 RepID=A0ABX9SB90_PARPN|nr:hypothetical protein BDE18_0604 [Paracoccus pantotrophus]